MISDDALQRQVSELSERVAALEAILRGAPSQAESPQPSTSTPPPPQPIARSVSLESRIGGQWLNRVGIAAVLMGMAWFLKLAVDRNWIGPSVRILVGLASAGGLLAWSELIRRRGYPTFSYSLKALGTGIAYLSLWAAFSLFHLAPGWIIFAAMTAVTLLNAWLAHLQNSEVLAGYALAGGLATPGLLHVEQGSPSFLFSYLILLNVGALFLLIRHSWRRLAWAALFGTSIYSIGWTFSAENPAHALVAFFLAVLFGVFAAVPLLSQSDVTLAFPVMNAAVSWIGLMALFGTAARPVVTAVLALACWLLALIPSVFALGQTHLALGLFFVTAAIPLKFHDQTLTLCWLAEAVILAALARRFAGPAFRISSQAAATLAAALVLFRFFVGSQPLGISLTAAVALAAVARLSTGRLRNFAGLAFGLTVLLAACLEVHHYWFCGGGFLRDRCGGYGQLERRTIMADFGYSACCMAYGAILITAGFLRRSAFLRWQALVLFALSVALIFLNGISLQGQGYRVISFLGLGVLLLAVSFVYQKDWLHLRG